MTVPGTEHPGLPEVFPQPESVEVGLGWFGRWTRPVQIAATIQAPLLRSAKVRAALERWSERLPGSRREPDPDGRSLVIAVARDGRGRPLATTALTGPDPYEMTGSLLAWAAVHAAQPDAVLRPGAHEPGRRLRPRHSQTRCGRGRSTRSRRDSRSVMAAWAYAVVTGR
ncbi:hypothetical protein P1P68_00340 [Streptomyces scabiei]|uniref:hypothetical protein n=1 Tax=Streptomyces scabiei TaxID=1930 RepID=UPI00298F7717|nr:hypothetical protein [Streptomyces scabiei]MDW8803297.1 hypothetical protein [Streptomyces scabiei]